MHLCEEAAGKQIITLADKDFKSALTRQLSLPPPLHCGGLYVWVDTAAPANGMRILCSSGQQVQLTRYLDRFYVAMPDDEEPRGQLVERFFDWIAEDYEKSIDVHRNIENIDNLLRLLREQGIGKREHTVLDFGCGPGLALRSQGCQSAQIIGFDPSPAIRRLAQKAGMKVWDPADLARQPHGAINAVIASYVLHTAAVAYSVRRVVSCLREGGIFAANFHKGAGREWADALFDSLQMQVIREEHSNLGRHGPYVVYQR